MEAFATTKDLIGYYRIMDASEMERAESLLSYATAKMRTYMAQNGVVVDGNDEVQAELLRGICCTSVRRAMEAPGGEGTIPAWGGSAVYSPSGDIYFTTAEKRDMLGDSIAQCVFALTPMRGDDDADGRDRD